jgi:hypothetical protein
MNEIRRTNPDAEEMSRLTAIVGSHSFPDFVTGFDLELGEFQDDPVAWITFHITGGDALPFKELQAQSNAIRPLQDELTSALLDQSPARFPFFRYKDTETDARR